MGDGKFKISGSQTGNYYVVKNGKRTYYDKKGNKMEPSAFLQAEGATIAKDGSMRKSKNVDAKSKLVKHRLPGSKTGRYYTEDAHGNKTYYAANGTPIRPDYFYQEENKAIDAAKKKNTQAAAPKKKSWWDNVKSFGKKCWDGAKAFGKGMVKSVTKMFTDENGKFSWKQTFKTVGTCLAVTVGAAALVAAEVLTAGQVTWLLVGAGAVMGAGTVAKGVVQYSNANTREEKLAAIETMGEGTGEIGMAALTKRPMGASMKAVSAASKAERMAALASGSGRTVAWAKGVGAGMKTVVPSPKQAWEGIQNGTKTAYNAVRHPVKTTRTALQNRRARIQARESIKGDVETIRTQEDLVAARKRVNESDVLTPKQKAKLNKKLDKINKEELPHQDIAALRERANDTSLSPREHASAQKEYQAAIKRSTDRTTLERMQNEGMQEFSALDEAGFRAKINDTAPRTEVQNDALINSIKKSEKLTPEVKAELLADLESKGIKLSDNAVLVEERIGAIDQMQRTEFTDLISQAELKPLTRRQKLTNKVKTKKHKTQTEYDTLKARIENEVKSPELRAELLKKLEAKQKLLDDIGAMKKHPEFKEYQSLIKRAKGDEYALSLLEKKLAGDHSFFKSPTTKAQRSKLYREIYKEQHKINPEKYPDIEMRLKAKEQKKLIEDTKQELKEIKRDLKKAERQANPDKVQEELTAAENKLTETETTLRNELESMKANRNTDVNESINRKSEIQEALREIEAQKARIQEIRSELVKRQTAQEQYEDGVSALKEDIRNEISARRNQISERETAIEQLKQDDVFLERQQELYRSQREFLEETYNRQAAGEIKQGKNGVVEELQAKESSVQAEIDALRTELGELKAPKKRFFESKEKFARREAEYNARKTQLEEQIRAKEYEKAEWGELRETAENSTQSAYKDNLNNTLYEREYNVKAERQRVSDEISIKESEIEGLNRAIELTKQHGNNIEATAEQVKGQYTAETQRLNQEIETISERITQTEAKVTTLREQQAAYRERLSRTNEAINSKKAELEALKKETHPDRVKIKKLEDELADLRKNHDVYQAKYDKLNAELAKKQAKLARLEKSYAKKQTKLKTIHKSGGAIMGGVVGTQALQEMGRTIDQVQALMAALAMEEGELTEEDLLEEAEEDAGEVLDEEAIEDAAADAVDDGTVADNSDGTTVTDGTTTPDSNASTTPDGNTTPGGNASTTPDGNTTPGGNASTTPDGNTTPGGNASTTPDGNTTSGGNASTTPDGNITPDGKDKPEGVTIQTYVSGRDSKGVIREITPAERMLITQQIERAQTIEDIALIYTELRSFKKFEGRKNLLKAIKQKRKSIEGKKNNYNERYDKIQDSKVYRADEATIAAHPEQKTKVYETRDLGEITVKEKKKPFFRRIFGGGDYNPYLVANGDNPARITLEVPTVIAEGEVKEPATPVIPAAEAAAAHATTPATTVGDPTKNNEGTVDGNPTTLPEQQGQSDSDTGLNITDDNLFGTTSPENLTAEVTTTDDLATGQEEKIPEQPLVAQADVPSEDDEEGRKLDIGDGWGLA